MNTKRQLQRIKLSKITRTNFTSNEKVPPPLIVSPKYESAKLMNQNYIGQHKTTKTSYAPKSTQDKLSSLMHLSLTEASLATKRLPETWMRQKIISPKSSSQISTMTELNLKVNQDSIFVVKQPMNDVSQLKVYKIQREELQNNGDIYKHRTQIIERLQEELKATKHHKNLSLFNGEPIQFFEEIPSDCNLIFLNSTLKIDFWQLLFSSHYAQSTQSRINKLLNVIKHLNDVEDFKVLVNDNKVFCEYLETKQIEQFDPFLTDIKPEYNKTKTYYSSRNIYEIEERNILNKADTPAPDKSKPIELFEFFDEQNYENHKDFSILIRHPKPNVLQDLLISSKLSPKAPKKPTEQYLKLPNFKTQYKQLVKEQSRRQQHENRFIDFRREVAQNHPTMIQYNIPKIMAETGFNRQEVHEVYSRYKALLAFECQNIPGMTRKLMPNGISLESFNAGLDELSMAPSGVVDQLFQFFAKSNSMNFEGFLKAINLIKAKQNDNKIEMILKLIDENQNGLLSYDEIKNRCVLMMDDMLKGNDGELSVDNMVDYITRSIFDAVKLPYHEEIPIDKIRKLIESKSQEAKVLIMICCGDVNYIN
ncbi:hypothetical protein pb186bvf_008343 [Paramecium bursaria]